MTKIICEKEDCVFLKRRKDNKYNSCTCEIIGIDKDGECDSYISKYDLERRLEYDDV